MEIKKILEISPSMKECERNFTIKDGEKIGISSCGEKYKGKEIYKLLTCEGYMLTFLKEKQNLIYMEKMKLH